MRIQHKSYLTRLIIVTMVSEVRLVLNLKKAWFYIVCEAHVYSPEASLLRKVGTLPNGG